MSPKGEVIRVYAIRVVLWKKVPLSWSNASYSIDCSAISEVPPPARDSMHSYWGGPKDTHGSP